MRLPLAVDPDLAQHGGDVAGLGLGVGVRDIAHVQDQVGLDDLFQRRAECRDQLVG